jgi:hypothetical protein
MTLTRKDAAGTALTILVVLTFIATHESWGVPLVGDSHRWAAGVIMLLGTTTCALGSPGEGTATRLLMALGSVALVLGLLALVFGSLTVLSLFVAAIVLLWAASTVRHVGRLPHRTVTS